MGMGCLLGSMRVRWWRLRCDGGAFSLGCGEYESRMARRDGEVMMLSAVLWYYLTFSCWGKYIQ